MSESEFQVLLEHAKRIKMSAEHKEAQRRSFAYGNANIENEAVTREMIDEAADTLKKSQAANQSEISNSDSC
jgi:hypothetical protein